MAEDSEEFQPPPDADEKPQPSYVEAPEPDPWTHLEPLFPIDSLTTESKCPHRGPIPRGSSMVCMICHESGKDGTRALPRNVKPLPEDAKPDEADAELEAAKDKPPRPPDGLRGGIG